MISVGRVQFALFVLAMAALVAMCTSFYFGMDEVSLSVGLASGWLIGVFQAANHIIITYADKVKKHEDPALEDKSAGD